jgi:hypothetical protein
MKKILFSSLMVLAFSFMASAQNKQPSKPATQPTSKTATQPTQKQPQTTTQTQQKSSATQQKSSTMTKPKHKKHHHKTKHTSTTK